MKLSKPPIEQKFITERSSMSREWSTWFTNLWVSTSTVNLSGTTAQRPDQGLFIGLCYFDTSLNLPIWLKSANPSVWINASGGVV